jgi:hypothetical protein
MMCVDGPLIKESADLMTVIGMSSNPVEYLLSKDNTISIYFSFTGENLKV